MASYTDVHRAFLQSVSHHGAVSAKQAHVILQSIYSKYLTGDQRRDNFFNVITAINARILRYGQTIKLIHYEPSGTDFYVFCNLSDSPLERFQTGYSEPEATYFGLVLKEVACSDGQRAREMVCINLNVLVTTSRPAFSKVRAEQLLDDWTKSGYFGQLDGMMILGPRTVAEFGRFLRAHYKHRMAICLMCKEVVFYGVKCSNCPERFHSKCKETYLRRIGNCPGCQKMLEVAEIC